MTINWRGDTYNLHRMTVEQTPGLERNILHVLTLPPLQLFAPYFEPDLMYKSLSEIQTITIDALDREYPL